MSSLKVSQIKSKLLSMFETHLDLSDVSLQDAERQSKILTRCLAAFAVYSHTNCSTQEAAGAVWDGPDDNGIDAAYFDLTESRVVVVQSKWIHKGSGQPAAKDLGVFIKGVRDLIEQDDSNFHPRLHARFKDIALRLSVPGTYVDLVVVSTGGSELAKHGSAVLDGLVNELNQDDPEPIVSRFVLGLSDVYAALANEAVQSAVSLDANVLEWSYVATPYPAYFGLIDGLQLKEWWRKFGKRLVSANIRHALGNTDVNSQIRQTAASAPEKFWYFNNGITLVADEALKAPMGAASRASGNFTFKSASIVNGAQTVSSLGRLDDDVTLGNIRVSVRVILLKTTPEART